MLRLRALWLLSAIVIHAPAAACAKEGVAREASLFDRPLTIQRIPPKTDTDPVGEIRCSYYPDFMIRETGTNTPAPGAASIIRGSGNPQRPPCNAEPSANEVLPKTANNSFAGRKGPFLFFSATDPNGAVPFMVINSIDARVIYNDGRINDGFKSVTLTGTAVRLRYLRGVNGSCSIYKEGPSCWAKLMTEGKVPRVLAQSQPSIQVCAVAYRKAKAPANDPSIISYDVDVTLEKSGKARVNSRGTVGCDAMP